MSRHSSQVFTRTFGQPCPNHILLFSLNCLPIECSYLSQLDKVHAHLCLCTVLNNTKHIIIIIYIYIYIYIYRVLRLLTESWK